MDQDTFCSLKCSGVLAFTDTKKARDLSPCTSRFLQHACIPQLRTPFFHLPSHNFILLWPFLNMTAGSWTPFKDLCDEDGGTQISQDNFAPPIPRSLTLITPEKCHFPSITQLQVPGTRVWTYSGKPFFCLCTSLSESQFPHLYNRRDNGSYFIGL